MNKRKRVCPLCFCTRCVMIGKAEKGRRPWQCTRCLNRFWCVTDALSPEAKERLKAAAKERRRKNPVAKDYDATDWLMACDKAEEEGAVATTPSRMATWAQLALTKRHRMESLDGYIYCELRRLSPAVLRALVSRLPHGNQRVERYAGPSAGKVSKNIYVFDRPFIEAVFRVLHLDTRPHLRYIRPKELATQESPT